MAAEVAGMDDACHLLAALDLFNADIFGLGFKDEAMHGMALCTGVMADVIGRQRQGVTLPLGRQRLPVNGKLAANAIGIGNQERRTEPVAQVPEGVIILVEHLRGAGQIG